MKLHTEKIIKFKSKLVTENSNWSKFDGLLLVKDIL